MKYLLQCAGMFYVTFEPAHIAAIVEIEGILYYGWSTY